MTNGSSSPASNSTSPTTPILTASFEPKHRPVGITILAILALFGAAMAIEAASIARS